MALEQEIEHLLNEEQDEEQDEEEEEESSLQPGNKRSLPNEDDQEYVIINLD